MKQLFQIARGIALALVLFELLVWAGGRSAIARAVVGAFPVPVAAAVLLLCLYVTFVRKGRAKAAPVDRGEYLVTMRDGAYGRIGGVFDRSRYGHLKRLPGGWLAGVRTYRAEDGSLLFTVRGRGARGSLPAARAVCAAVLAFVLLGPLSALSYVNAANQGVGDLLQSAGLTRRPYAMSYLDVPRASLPWSSDKPAAGNTGPSDDAHATDGGIVRDVGGWLTDARDWVAGLLPGGRNDILPSDRRALTDSDVAGMDAAQIQRAINEMYARYGYDLSSSADADYFAAQDWYDPDPSLSSGEVRAQFSDTETDNLKFLIECRDKLKQ